MKCGNEDAYNDKRAKEMNIKALSRKYIHAMNSVTPKNTPAEEVLSAAGIATVSLISSLDVDINVKRSVLEIIIQKMYDDFITQEQKRTKIEEIYAKLVAKSTTGDNTS